MSFSFDIAPRRSDEEALRRVALRQAALRKVNEAMRGAPGEPLVAVRCECGQLGCNQLIQLAPAEYEAVRGHARRFAIVAGHAVVEIEDTIERHDRYAVAETRAPVAVAIAEATSPRHRAL